MEVWMQDVESIDVPACNCSKFELLCNPEEERAVGEADAWLRERAKERGLEDKEGELDKLIASQVGKLACQFWPHSRDLKLTRTLVQALYWLFAFDNIMDDPRMLGADAEASLEFCGYVLQAFLSLDSSQALRGLDVLRTRASAGSLVIPTLVLTLVVEWWAELRSRMSARQQARFCSQFADYLLVNARQSRFKEEKEVPGVEEYLRIRIVGAAMPLLEMLVELDCGIELDEEELRNPSVKRLNKATALQTGLLNDYVGFAHEYEEGDYFNLLTVLHYRNNVTAKDYKQNADHRVPFHRACEEAWAITAALEEECIACAKDVQDWAHMHSKPGLLKYVASLCSMSAANWAFTVDSSRFTDFHNNCVQLPAAAESHLQSTLRGAVPITRIFLTRPNAPACTH